MSKQGEEGRSAGRQTDRHILGWVRLGSGKIEGIGRDIEGRYREIVGIYREIERHGNKETERQS
jgi:hypothetical protein